jgi:mono/diheme cytochrome c family protein
MRSTGPTGRPLAGGARPAAFGLAAVLLLALASGCRLEMYDQPHVKPLEKSTFYPDSLSARPYIQGTVARTQVWTNSNTNFSEATGGLVGEHGTGRPAGADSVTAWAERMSSGEQTFDRNGGIPIPVTHELVLRGQERFNIYCSPCHGRLGDGNGMVVERGFPRPPSFHIDRMRQAADGYFYDVITNGFGVMYSYAARVVPEDRWAITAYIRALQLSQNSTAQDLPPQERNK